MNKEDSKNNIDELYMVKRKSLKKRTKKMMRNKKTRRINRQKGGNKDDMKRFILDLNVGIEDVFEETPKYKVIYACTAVRVYEPELKATSLFNNQDKNQKIQEFRDAIQELRDEYGVTENDIDEVDDNVFNDEDFEDFAKVDNDAKQIYEEFAKNDLVGKKRTRSNTVITPTQSEFAQLGPPRKRTSGISLNTTVASESTIKLSDGKEYNINDIRDMWRFSKTHTPLRHPYSEDDIKKIKAFIDFMKGGKAKRSRRTRKK